MNTLISLIVAVDKNNGISKNNEIPWKIKEDSNYFQDTTKRNYDGKQNSIILGKNTWKAFPPTLRGLKERINIVVSTTMTEEELKADNVTGCEAYLVKSLSEAITLSNKLDLGRIFICGGSKIYEEAIDTLQINELYITRINKDYKCDNKFSVDLDVLSTSKGLSCKTKNFNVTDLNTNEKVDIEFTKYSDICQMTSKNLEEQQYLDLLENILKNGDFRKTRNSNTWSLFGKTMEFDLAKGFPLLTTKKVFFRGVFEELLFFLKGDTNAKNLSDKGVKIWDANTSREFLDSHGLGHYDEHDMGPMYSFQFRHNGIPYQGMNADYSSQGFDQIEYCLNLLKTDPFSRRILMTSFNPSQAGQGVLYPCHGIVIQFYVEKGHKLSCSMHQRSADIGCGSPFNISSYGLLVHMFCEVINNDSNYDGPKFSPGRLIMNHGDIHIYEDHYSDLIRQILREPYKFPQLTFKRKVSDLTDFKYEDLELVDYQCYPSIPAKMIA